MEFKKCANILNFENFQKLFLFATVILPWNLLIFEETLDLPEVNVEKKWLKLMIVLIGGVEIWDKSRIDRRDSARYICLPKETKKQALVNIVENLSNFG